MANKKTRERNRQILEQAGLLEEFKGVWHTVRDHGADRLRKEIREYQQAQKLPERMPSDIPKRIRIKEPNKEPRDIIADPIPPPKNYPPPEIPDGKIIVFWQDITKRKGKPSRYPRAFEELIKNKKIMRKQDPEAILKFIFGEKGNKDNEGHIKIDKGKIGDVDIRVYSSEEELKLIKKEYRGWKILYNGKAKIQRDLLVAFAAVVSSVYNSRLTRDAAGYFIDQVKKIHPANGEWLDELYKKYAEKGFE